MSTELINNLASATEAGSRLPFLSAGVNGCRYGLRLLGVSQWEAKKSPAQKKGDWRCQFRVEIMFSEGDGALPEKTIAGLLIMEDKQYGTYHLQDFRKIGGAIMESAGDVYSEKPELVEKTKANIEKLFAGGYNGALFIAQVTPNPDAAKAKFPITTYFPFKEEGEVKASE